MQQVIEYQDIDPSDVLTYRKGASVAAIAPYVRGLKVAPAIPAPVAVETRLQYRGNGALPNNAYDVAA